MLIQNVGLGVSSFHLCMIDRQIDIELFYVCGVNISVDRWMCQHWGESSLHFTFLPCAHWRVRPWCDDANCLCSVLAFGLGSVMSIQVVLFLFHSNASCCPPLDIHNCQEIFVIVSLVSVINRLFYSLRDWLRANLTSRTWWFDFGLAFS